MTVTEQLTAWAAHPGSDILVSFAYDGKPCVVGRIKARDAVAGFKKRIADGNVATVGQLKSITCVVVEGHAPDAFHSRYRAVLTTAESFT